MWLNELCTTQNMQTTTRWCINHNPLAAVVRAEGKAWYRRGVEWHGNLFCELRSQVRLFAFGSSLIAHMHIFVGNCLPCRHCSYRSALTILPYCYNREKGIPWQATVKFACTVFAWYSRTTVYRLADVG